MTSLRWVGPIFAIAAIAFAMAVAVWPAAQAQEADTGELDAAAVLQLWLQSAHANAESEAFTHWDDEGEIPEDCAICHSGLGIRDFFGDDGSAVGTVDHPAEVGTLVDCDSCHIRPAMDIASVTFPSGATVTGADGVEICMVCHQGRESTVSVNERLAGLADDEPNSDLGFVNVHYRAAAATMFGTEVKGGYEYEGKSYLGKSQHPANFDICTDCHDPHTLEVAFEPCAQCHFVDSFDEIRLSHAPMDYDGDGDLSEGIKSEVEALHGLLAQAISAYGAEVAGTPIAYADSYPYFFNDTNADGAIDESEAAVPNRYQSWTPRLLRAAYNYQFVAKDPGAWAHNPHYVLQLLYDSVEDLAAEAPIEMPAIARP